VKALPRVVVRRATHDDFKSLVKSLKQREYFNNRLNCQESGAGVLLIALYRGRPIGDVFLEFEPDGEEYAELVPELALAPLLQHLEVLPAFRNRGIGTKLLARCERELRALGHRRVVLGVSATNAPAIRLYRRLGYTFSPDPEVPVVTKAVIYDWNADGTRTASGMEECLLMTKVLNSENGAQVGAVPAVSAVGV
jgi:GNAT superfamily N-acetyltransferase